MGDLNSAVAHLVRRIPLHELPAKYRCWTGNDSNARCHHGVIPPGEDTAFVELRWKRATQARERLVGGFEIRLRRLVREGYLYEEPSGGVRLKFVHGTDGCVYIGRGMTKKRIPIGRA